MQKTRVKIFEKVLKDIRCKRVKKNICLIPVDSTHLRRNSVEQKPSLTYSSSYEYCIKSFMVTLIAWGKQTKENKLSRCKNVKTIMCKCGRTQTDILIKVCSSQENCEICCRHLVISTCHQSRIHKVKKPPEIYKRWRHAVLLVRELNY